MCEKKSPLFRHVMSSAKVIAAQWTDDGRPILEEHDLSEAIACARGPDVLTTSEASRVAAAKAEGNRVFRSGDIDSALAAYNEALRVYSDRCGNAAQRLEKSKLLSNRAECLLRLNEWEAASRSASIAISLDAACAKARFRRARALCEIGGDSLEEALNELAELRRLRADGLHLINTRAESELQSRIVAQQEELRRIRHHDAKTLRTAFASGSAALSGDSDACSVWDDGSTRGSMDDPSLQWVSRLPANTHHAYLIDCYRTCVEDDMGSERYGETMGSAETIRAIGQMAYEGSSQTAEAVRLETIEACWKDGGLSERGRPRHMITFDGGATVFAEVGGPLVWHGLLTKLGESLQ